MCFSVCLKLKVTGKQTNVYCDVSGCTVYLNKPTYILLLLHHLIKLKQTGQVN